MNKIIDQINKKIDQMTVENFDAKKINAHLDLLKDPIFLKNECQNDLDFANEIIQMVEKDKGVTPFKARRKWEKKKMNRKQFKLVAATLILCFSLGAVAFASGFINVFKIYSQEETIEIRTSDSLSEGEIKAVVENIAEEDEVFIEEGQVIQETEYKAYSEISEVEDEFNLSICLPTYIPSGMILEEEILVSTYFENSHNIYITYASKDNKNQIIGVTIVKENISEGETRVTATDTIFEKEYISKNGTRFDLLHEDDALIFTTDVDMEQYGFVFMDLEEAEIYKVIDSIDFKSKQMNNK
ncbi:hypothetical protein [Fusibacter sp. JL216-2]|uniref:hypothetical protein n=1 Tax=Fusibacter sp. JL216-2 TaxID=3071453 RepID=UPI003D34DDC1